MENALMVVQDTEESKALVVRISDVWGLPPVKAQKLLSTYGEEIVFYAMEIRSDNMLTVGLGHFRALVQQGLSAEEVKTMYLTKAFCADKAKENRVWCSVSVVQLARLAQKFEDFRIADEGYQLELAEEILRVFRWTGFRHAVDQVIKRAEETGIISLQEMMDAADDFWDGSVFDQYFSDDEEHDW